MAIVSALAAPFVPMDIVSVQSAVTPPMSIVLREATSAMFTVFVVEAVAMFNVVTFDEPRLSVDVPDPVTAPEFKVNVPPLAFPPVPAPPDAILIAPPTPPVAATAPPTPAVRDNAPPVPPV